MRRRRRTELDKYLPTEHQKKDSTTNEPKKKQTNKQKKKRAGKGKEGTDSMEDSTATGADLDTAGTKFGSFL